MARQRKKPQSPSNISGPSNAQEIPEEEQWRIIEKTGVLENIPLAGDKPTLKAAKVDQPEDNDDDPFTPFCQEVFNTILLLIPFSSLYVMMDILAHRQYAQRYDTWSLIETIVWGIPLLSVFVFYTTRYKSDRRMQALLFLLSIGCGSRLIYVVNWASWMVVVRQCPPLGTVWVYTILQLDLLHAVLALAVVAGYTKWKDLKIIF